MRKRYKLLLIMVISFLLVFFSYFLLKKDTFIYVNLGANLSFNNFSTLNYSEYIQYHYKNIKFYEFLDEYNPSETIYQQIINNNDNINYFLKNANIITISLGTIELNNYKELNEEIILNYINNIYKLISKLSKLNKNVFIINLYDKNYNFVNNKIKEYCNEYDMIYIGKDTLSSGEIYRINLKTYLNYKGHKEISDFIVNKYDKKK